MQSAVKEVTCARENVQARFARLLCGPGQDSLGRHYIVRIALREEPVAVGIGDGPQLEARHRRRHGDE